MAAEFSDSGGTGKIKQSVSRWCFGGLSLDELCIEVKKIGLVGLDLLGPNDWDTVRKHGLICTMASGIGNIPDGFNRIENHDKLVQEAESMIPLVASAGFPNLITFSGNRNGISDEEGLANCVKGLKRIMPIAEKYKVTICMELLNSKRDHRDYQCDTTAWGVEVVKAVGSERFKLLYDIYHMQIMEGDICATIRENIQYIGHFHTGGNPGRNEIDDTQEIYYPRVMREIANSGYDGFVAHEFIPRRDPLTSLREAYRICNV
jgi:hydroxypyruvate isomerase